MTVGCSPEAVNAPRGIPCSMAPYVNGVSGCYWVLSDIHSVLGMCSKHPMHPTDGILHNNCKEV